MNIFVRTEIIFDDLTRAHFTFRLLLLLKSFPNYTYSNTSMVIVDTRIRNRKFDPHFVEYMILAKYLHESCTYFPFRFGPISSTKAILDKATNRCKGYGFVDFESPNSALSAVNELQNQGYQVSHVSPGLFLLFFWC